MLQSELTTSDGTSFRPQGLVHDFIAYSLVHCTYTAPVAYDQTADRRTYNIGADSGWAIPPLMGPLKSVEAVGGQFKDNLFFGTKGYLPFEVQIRVPKDTDIRVERSDLYSSNLIFENRFVIITMYTQVPIVPITNILTFIDSSHFDSVSAALDRESDYANRIRRERSARYRQYFATVVLVAMFKDAEARSPDMKLYQEWTNSLFSSVSRRLAWGQPKLISIDEAFRRGLVTVPQK